MMNTKRDIEKLGFQGTPSTHQKGMATLVVTVVVLIIITLMVFFAAKVGIFDQRMSANEYRYKEAFAAADGGLEYATQQFTENVSFIKTVGSSGGDYKYDPNKDGNADAIPNPFLSNNNLAGGTASGSEARFTASVGTTTSGGVTVYTLTSVGESIDRTGTASVSEQIVIRSITAGNTPDTPIIADGSMAVSGNMHVVANPNGSCTGCAVSVWTHNAVDTGSSISTCHILGFFPGGQCPNPSLDDLHTQLTNGPDQGVDIIQIDPYTTDSPAGNFPPDLFEYIFGVPYTQWQSIKSAAESLTPSQVYSDCNSLDSSSKGIIWITGDCQINANATIGSEANPVILVVQNHDLSIGGNVTIYGIVFLFDETPADNSDDPDLDIGGGTKIIGSLISGVDIAGGTGTVAVVWDKNIFDNIQNNSGESYRQVASIPGSWRDF
ncbi:PilX N-terminal domain-containing pilus assembly protein [Methylobacter svalbardensis]|uniref:PilX N-terminal domain-containing pilus assembly protein n=1 Tax=Methylobacter svalbardensis TaxID=3080016 RepID=UPI0030EE389E